MPRRRPAESGQAAKREAGRDRKLADLRARLHEEARALRTPEDWARCMHLAARLPGESFANILLISSRQPGATLVRGYQAWHATGNQVSRNEKGIEIFSARRTPPKREPQDQHQETDAHHPSWRDADRIAYVWDISQTSGRPAPPGNDQPPPADPPPALWDALCLLARREGFAVEREHGCPDDGVTMWTARRIRIPPGLTEHAAAWALVHQLGHVFLHNAADSQPGTNTSACAGVHRAEADSVAFIICARNGITAQRPLPYPATWAGNDPRAQPAGIILATGHRITTAATRIARHLDHILPSENPSAATRQYPVPSSEPENSPPDATAPSATARNTRPAAAPDRAEPAESTRRALADAASFYAAQLTGAWAPAYLLTRGISDVVARDWAIGYAPAGWTTLTDHLRSLGHDDDTIQAAGLARRSSRGTLIDHFRDRVVLPLHDEHGQLAGFVGRAHPDAGPDVPKYLNSPETPAYRKSELLSGLHQARPHLAQGAIPVIVEGPFDAMAVTIADPARHAGLAPCGTALTTQQAEILSRAADLSRTGILVAFDADPAGRKAARRAHRILHPHTRNLQSVQLAGKDPAEILQRDGPQTLRTALREQTQPLSALLIDSNIEKWGRRLRDTEGPLLAMRSTAALIAELLPPEAADDALGPAASRDLTRIARSLPADTAYQIMRTADRLSFDASDVLAEVASVATQASRSPKDGRRDLGDDLCRSGPAAHATPARLAGSSFPGWPVARITGTDGPSVSILAAITHAERPPRVGAAHQPSGLDSGGADHALSPTGGDVDLHVGGHVW